MTMMPPKSSATARAARNIFKPIGQRLLKILRQPSENAISVAMGIAIPRSMTGSFRQTRKNTITGTIMPPQAPMTGARAFFMLDNSPQSTSRLISKPTLRKKMAIRKSLMKAPKCRACPPWLNRLKPPILRLTGNSQNFR